MWQTLALTLLTSGVRLVGIVRSRIQATEFFFSWRSGENVCITWKYDWNETIDLEFDWLSLWEPPMEILDNIIFHGINTNLLRVLHD
jgi:hypothetical protein